MEAGIIEPADCISYMSRVSNAKSRMATLSKSASKAVILSFFLMVSVMMHKLCDFFGVKKYPD